MQNQTRPNIFKSHDTSEIETFISELQEAIENGNVALFNQRFAQDILWGSPFAAIANGYDQIHSIHKQMFSSVTPVKGAAKYEAENIRFVSEQVAIAYVRRISKIPNISNQNIKPGSFDELALFVLVKENEQWWLAAAQHVPDRREVYLK
ncbi:YybH family protein [Sphingobacterium faecale]|uniref:DUF4440 domain-containing protein n=1 Tax=Sphingobacterium faecale TaxID=2803775 RepID=A0ABS1R7G7_9SPHI|nr:DUF4440 domain-containing protein [Sphingobacterium faecale]MBL1409942.1 DUF4440 domain-containing protein [Sphingobacterium faecale]